jgi:hypothetical protein
MTESAVALGSLGLVDRNNPLTELVAKKVIELHADGLNDPAEIADTTLELPYFSRSGKVTARPMGPDEPEREKHRPRCRLASRRLLRSPAHCD